MTQLLAAILLLVCSSFASGQLMSVKDLKDLIARGPDGELGATSYVQGVVDGMLGMDAVNQKEKKLPAEFCRFLESYKRGKPERHPAYRTKQLVTAWEKEGFSMNAPAVDMVLSFMTSQYGCKR
jgi:hypothetical protein